MTFGKFVISVLLSLYCVHTVASEMVLVPAGEFIMGSDNVENEGNDKEFGSIKPWYLDEHPKHKERLGAFYIDKYEVTNREFRDFVVRDHYEPPTQWLENGYLLTLKRERLTQLSVVKLRHLIADVFKLDIDSRKMTKQQLLNAFDEYFDALGKLPVTQVSWFDAMAYCKGLGKTLPTEAQWERVARGMEGKEFPWGNDFQPGLSNTGDEDWPRGAAPVGSYQQDQSEGVFDIAGNVSEWTADWYRAYQNSDYNTDDFGENFKVVRGAGWGGSGHYALKMYQRGAYRLYLRPDAEHEDLGFRCAKDANETKSAGM